jgi:hypothetical protein
LEQLRFLALILSSFCFVLLQLGRQRLPFARFSRSVQQENLKTKVKSREAEQTEEQRDEEHEY